MKEDWVFYTGLVTIYLIILLSFIYVGILSIEDCVYNRPCEFITNTLFITLAGFSGIMCCNVVYYLTGDGDDNIKENINELIK